MIRFHISATLLITACLCCSAHAQQSPKQENSDLVLMAGTGDSERMDQLASALDAHLSDLGIEITTSALQNMPPTFAEQLGLARVAAASGEVVVSVVWLEGDRDELLIYLSRAEAHKVEVLAMPSTGEGWDEDCDAIATIMRSTLVAWLEDGEIDADSPAEELPPARSQITKDDKRKEEPLLRAVLSAGYSPASISWPSTWAHGLHLSAGAKISKWAQLDVAIVTLQSVHLDIGVYDARLVRWPLEFAAIGLLPLGAVELGARLGLLVDNTGIEGLPKSPGQDETDATRLAIAPSVLFRAHLVGGTFVWAQIGVDIFAGDREYLWDEKVVLRYDRVQFRIALGLAVMFPRSD